VPRLSPAFQKYSDQYDVDWLLIAAQGYQESQLNRAINSPVGVIGVMQVMSATGKELGVATSPKLRRTSTPASSTCGG
jgi:membrane-bound lytic murein transglycosylase MltF